MVYNPHYKDNSILLNIMREKGVTILPSEEDYAKYLLNSIGYSTLVKGFKNTNFVNSNGDFEPKIEIYELYSLYLLNNQITGILFKNLLIIEHFLKIQICTYISRDIGTNTSLDYADIDNNQSDFLCKKHYRISRVEERNKILYKLKKRVIKTYDDGNPDILYFKENKNYLPPWIFINAIYLTDTIKWYSILKEEGKNEICNNFSKIQILDEDEDKQKLILQLLKLVRDSRNKIAHNEFLIKNNKTSSKNNFPVKLFYKSYKDSLLQGISKKKFKNISLYYSLILIVSILLDDEFLYNTFIYDLDNLLIRYEDFSIGDKDVYDILGIPKDIILMLKNLKESLIQEEY